MKLLMHVLKENKKLKIDNQTIGEISILSKLDEEYKEVVKAVMDYKYNKSLTNLMEVIRETFDLIQMCILILWRCDKVAKNDYNYPGLLKDINIEHKDKLISRAWIIETGIEIDIKD